jgi:hypothetical protein
VLQSERWLVSRSYAILKGRRKATPLFDTIDEQLEYMEDADLDVERATLLESLGRFSEAADVHFSEGVLAFYLHI